MKKVNKIQERYLRLMANNYELGYEDLPDSTNEIFPHQRWLNSVMTEIYKRLNGLSPDIMNDVLTVSKHGYKTRHYNWQVWSKFDPYRANQIGNLLPREMKNSANLDSFKLKIKQCRCLECTCT